MGATFSAIQIQNQNQIEPEQFKALLCKYFEKKGLVSATEDDAQVSFEYIFSKNRHWVTLNPEYEYAGKTAMETAQELSKAMKTTCIIADVVDSDFVELNLFGKTGTDKVFIGTPYGMEEMERKSEQGNPDLWKPLLAQDCTWEQLQNIWNGEYVYAEESLRKMASLLGMDKELLFNNASVKHDIVTLHLKSKSGQPGKTPATLNAAFKQVFGEALAPLGYVKIKGKYPYFVRLIGDEIIHVITFTNRPSSYPGYKEFYISGGVATVYCKRISLDKSSWDNSNWLTCNLTCYRKNNPFDSEETHRAIFDKLYSFSYKVDDAESILETVKHSLEATNTYLLPELNKVVDIDSCIEYFDKFGTFMFLYDDIDESGNKYNNFNEGLLYIKTNNHDAFEKKLEISKGLNYAKPEDMEDDIRIWQRQITIRDKINNNPELYAKALAELERRKAINTEILRSYGLNL